MEHDWIYLDHNATTRPEPRVVEACTRAMETAWGNPSSSHPPGRAARRALEDARERVAACLGASPGEVYFTSGGTESNNAAVLGVAAVLEPRGRHVVISSVEHPSVDAPCRRLESLGWEVTRVGVSAEGLLDLDAMERALRPDTVLISVMHANNETGVVQPVEEVVRLARRHGCQVHTDAAQSVGKIPVDARSLGVDLLSLAGHKVYGPRGIGALLARRDTPLGPWMLGAGHERGLRSGTESVPLAVGLAVACELARDDLPSGEERVGRLRDRLEARLKEKIPGLRIHGGRAPRLPNTSYVSFPGVEAAALLQRAAGVAAGIGAACHSDGSRGMSQVLQAMGVDPEAARGTVRLSLGRHTTAAEVEAAAARLADAWVAVSA